MILEPLTDQQTADLRRHFVERHGSELGEIAFQNALEKRKRALEEQAAGQAQAAELAARISARHDALARDLRPLEQARDRVAAELMRANAAIEDTRLKAQREIGEMETSRNAILGRLAGRFEPVELTEEQKVAAAKAVFTPPPGSLQEALSKRQDTVGRLV